MQDALKKQKATGFFKSFKFLGLKINFVFMKGGLQIFPGEERGGGKEARPGLKKIKILNILDLRQSIFGEAIEAWPR